MQSEVQKDLQIDQLYCTQKQQKFIQTLFIKKCAGKANNSYAKLLVKVPLMVLKYEILPNVSYSGFVYMFTELTNKVHLYLIDKKEYKLLNIDCTISDGAANCQYQNEIYFVGGSVLDNKKGYYVEIKQVHKVNLKGQSYKFSDLMEERSGCGAIILNKCLYAIGGYNKKQEALSSVEMLNLTNKSEKFKTLSSLNIPRHHLTIIGFKNYIFAMGGSNNTTQKSIEQYSIQQDQ